MKHNLFMSMGMAVALSACTVAPKSIDQQVVYGLSFSVCHFVV